MFFFFLFDLLMNCTCCTHIFYNTFSLPLKSMHIHHAMLEHTENCMEDIKQIYVSYHLKIAVANI